MAKFQPVSNLQRSSSGGAFTTKLARRKMLPIPTFRQHHAMDVVTASMILSPYVEAVLASSNLVHWMYTKGRIVDGPATLATDLVVSALCSNQSGARVAKLMSVVFKRCLSQLEDFIGVCILRVAIIQRTSTRFTKSEKGEIKINQVKEKPQKEKKKKKEERRERERK